MRYDQYPNTNEKEILFVKKSTPVQINEWTSTHYFEYWRVSSPLALFKQKACSTVYEREITEYIYTFYTSDCTNWLNNSWLITLVVTVVR